MFINNFFDIIFHNLQIRAIMIKVEFLGPISKDSLSLDITNLSQLSEILKSDKELEPWLKSSAVAINDTIVQDKNSVLKDGDKISLLPPVCGG